MEQLERIKYYETIFDEIQTKVIGLETALDEFEKVLGEIRELEEYYFGPVWREDRWTDEQGLLPKDLKRGILSEDGIYDLVTDLAELSDRLKEDARRTDPRG